MEQKSKQIAFVGLGRMGGAMCALLVEKGYTVHGYDTDKVTLNKAKESGVVVHHSIQETISALKGQSRIIWIMVPSRYVDEVLLEIKPTLISGDTVIDGGNSFFKESIRRHGEFSHANINFIDCGTSGGVDGARHGASLMVGGEKVAVDSVAHIFSDLATVDGFAHIGDPGSGHFTKMVHNAIEYGMMGAIAEGINILNEHKDGLGINIVKALKPYEHGSIIESNLMSWLGKAYNTKGLLEQIAGEVPKGETEMEMEYLIENEQVLVLEAAVRQRKETRTTPSFTGTLIAAMRNQFGGHTIVKKNPLP